jgi:hypothetical protein
VAVNSGNYNNNKEELGRAMKTEKLSGKYFLQQIVPGTVAVVNTCESEHE